MANFSTDEVAIQRFLMRAVENVYPTKEKLGEVLRSKQITAYVGIDPTGPTLHLGHVIWLRKLAELQKLGHRVIMLIGDFTAMIGDPTDKTATRQRLTRGEVLVNCQRYKQQASKFLKFDGDNPAELRFNSEWLASMSFNDVIDLAAHFTVQQMMERDMFEKRIKEAKPIYLHEFLYPLMQGYDSVKMDVDLEIGGNDQTFNMLAGRTLLREIEQKEKFVLTLKLLTDPTGKKMGKSEGNMVAFTDSPEDMYGKVMSWTDGMIIPAFELCTDLSDEEIGEMREQIEKGENPMIYKRRLAKEIVRLFLSDEAAEGAEAHFTRVHSEGEKPEEIKSFTLKMQPAKLIEVLAESGVVSSKAEARRQVEQGGVKVNDEVVKDIQVEVKVGDVIQKGKRHFVKLVA